MHVSGVTVMRRFSLSSFVAGLVVATALAAVPAVAAVQSGSASAPTDFDGRAPTLLLNPTTFQLGASIDATTPGDNCSHDTNHYHLPLVMSWVGSDKNLAGYFPLLDVIPVIPDGAQPTSATSYAYSGTTDVICGGGDYRPRPFVVAQDTAGNRTVSRLASGIAVDVWQQDGSNADHAVGVNGSLSLDRRSGSWTTSRCLCYDQGTDFYSTKAGSTLTYTVTPTGVGQTLALVTETSSTRGVMAITVDHGKAQYVDTSSASARHRIIVWQTSLPDRPVTVTITNTATDGRPRVDVDALMLTEPAGGVAPGIQRTQ